jgi:hypothetical protein
MSGIVKEQFSALHLNLARIAKIDQQGKQPSSVIDMDCSCVTDPSLMNVETNPELLRFMFHDP